jgi:hypothetical protein
MNCKLGECKNIDEYFIDWSLYNDSYTGTRNKKKSNFRCRDTDMIQLLLDHIEL